MPNTTNSSPSGLDIVNQARKYLGVPYLWGGTSPKGFDCSGLIQYVYRKFGINIPRTSQEQAHFGMSVPKSQIMPGDLLFYDTTGPNSHVALYAGGGMQVVARHTGLPVMMQKVGNFTHAQRVLHDPGAGVGGIQGATPAGYQTVGLLPSPQDVFGSILESIGVPDMKDLLERLGLILLGTGLVMLGLNVMGRDVLGKVIGNTSQEGGDGEETDTASPETPEPSAEKEGSENAAE